MIPPTLIQVVTKMEPFGHKRDTMLKLQMRQFLTQLLGFSAMGPRRIFHARRANPGFDLRANCFLQHQRTLELNASELNALRIQLLWEPYSCSWFDMVTRDDGDPPVNTPVNGAGRAVIA
jgi:hypothetical protein